MKKLFTSDKFFFAMATLAVIGLIEYGIYLFTGGTIAYSSVGGSSIMAAICTGALYVSYRKHHKNVMKCLIGALLMALILDGVASLSFINIAVDRICTPIYILISLGMFVNHCIINESRKASPAQVALNRVLVVAFAVNVIVWVGSSCILLNIRPIDTVSMAFYIIGCVCLAAVIVCVESRLDAYRLDREAAGWTEEAGYPEGYVREYEKKNSK